MQNINVNPAFLLEKKLNELKKFYEEHRKIITNEETTKQSLIFPFFEILGYDIRVPSVCMAEYSISKSKARVDYKICIDDSNFFFVEAKSASRNLNLFIDQVKEYYDNDKSMFVVLTNGSEYFFYAGEIFFKFNLLDYSIDDLNDLLKFYSSCISKDSIDNFIFNQMQVIECEELILSMVERDERSKKAFRNIVARRCREEQESVEKYSKEQIIKFGEYKYFEALDIRVFIPYRHKFEELANIAKYSKIFVSKVFMKDANVEGYLIGQFKNGSENIYCVGYEQLPDFIKNNGLNSEDFVNASYVERIDTRSGKKIAFLRSNVKGLQFSYFEDLVIQCDNFLEIAKMFE